MRSYADPRKEDQENSLLVENSNFKNLGWQPISLDEGLLHEVRDTVQKYSSRCDFSKIPCTSLWSAEQKQDTVGTAVKM